ncbi:MAG TPA: tripartite tricarboxylate transporter TctB family protein [Burkholderiales bacterium]|nr:tripartite tricarboxylate transporter TctB family protein [Burkholderiales bacterium]
MSRDGITGLAVLAASLVLFGLTLELKQNPLVPIGPGFYPRIVLGITAVLAAALVVFDFLGAKQTRKTQVINYSLVLAVFAIFGLYVGALPFLGFRIATFVFMAVLQTALDLPRNKKGWIVVAVTAFVTTAVTYIVFEHYLHVLLPRGRWTDF